MSFQEYADSVLAKVHFGDKRIYVLAGLAIIIALIGAVIVFRLLPSGNGFVISSQGEEIGNSGLSSDVSEVEEKLNIIYIHVAGAVVSPGICELPQGSRVNDAILACGGFAEDANTETLNLARVLSDGEQLLVPRTGTDAIESEEATSSAASSQGSLQGKININTATVSELDTLPGIGESTAQKIIDDRTSNGPFATIEDLKRVSGIGDKKYRALEDYICIG